MSGTTDIALNDGAHPRDERRVAIVEERRDQQKRDRDPVPRRARGQFARRIIVVKGALDGRVILALDALALHQAVGKPGPPRDDGHGHRQREHHAHPHHLVCEVDGLRQQFSHGEGYDILQ